MTNFPRFSVLVKSLLESRLPSLLRGPVLFLGGMVSISTSFLDALRLMIDPDSGFWPIVRLSLEVSLVASVLASILAIPFAAWLVIGTGRLRWLLTTLLNALMGLPAVVVGLAVYLLLSRAGPLGPAGLLFTPTAMVIAEVVLVAPLIAAIGRQSLEDLYREIGPYLRSLGMRPLAVVATLIIEARLALLVAVLAGFGRAIAEVGAVMIVGGNIAGVTRVMTTAIALETSKGELALAMALGLWLLLIVLAVNMVVAGLRSRSAQHLGLAS